MPILENSLRLYARIENAFQQEGREVNIDVIVQNHVEKDHSGLLVELHKKFPQAPLFTAQKSLVKGFTETFPCTGRCQLH